MLYAFLSDAHRLLNMKVLNRVLNKLLISLFVIVEYNTISCKIYNIIPTNNNCSCIEDPCLTLSQMTEKLNMSVDSNTTLVIMGGNYTLDHGINVSNTKYFSMLAANNSTTIITCAGAAAYFTLSKIFRVYISGLTFVGCGNNTVMFVHHLIIENTKSFGERSNGTFLIINHSSAELTKTFISNTSGKLEKHNIDRYLTYLQTISSANYQRYRSITLGGAIISTYSNLSIENCKFNGNKANIGGAIFSDLESSLFLGYRYIFLQRIAS